MCCALTSQQVKTNYKKYESLLLWGMTHHVVSPNLAIFVCLCNARTGIIYSIRFTEGSYFNASPMLVRNKQDLTGWVTNGGKLKESFCLGFSCLFVFFVTYKVNFMERRCRNTTSQTACIEICIFYPKDLSAPIPASSSEFPVRILFVHFEHEWVQ